MEYNAACKTFADRLESVIAQHHLVKTAIEQDPYHLGMWYSVLSNLDQAKQLQSHPLPEDEERFEKGLLRKARA